MAQQKPSKTFAGHKKTGVAARRTPSTKIGLRVVKRTAIPRK